MYTHIHKFVNYTSIKMGGGRKLTARQRQRQKQNKIAEITFTLFLFKNNCLLRATLVNISLTQFTQCEGTIPPSFLPFLSCTKAPC